MRRSVVPCATVWLKMTGRTILLETAVDPSVLGGVKLRYEGLELDGTAAGRLAALRRALTQA